MLISTLKNILPVYEWVVVVVVVAVAAASASDSGNPAWISLPQERRCVLPQGFQTGRDIPVVVKVGAECPMLLLVVGAFLADLAEGTVRFPYAVGIALELAAVSRS